MRVTSLVWILRAVEEHFPILKGNLEPALGSSAPPFFLNFLATVSLASLFRLPKGGLGIRGTPQ